MGQQNVLMQKPFKEAVVPVTTRQPLIYQNILHVGKCLLSHTLSAKTSTDFIPGWSCSGGLCKQRARPVLLILIAGDNITA